MDQPRDATKSSLVGAIVCGDNNSCVSSLQSLRNVYGDLIRKVIDQLQKSSVSFEDVESLLVPRLMIDLNSPQFQQRNARLNNIPDFFYHLRTKGYMPFYSLELLETIVEWGAEECQPSLEEYRTKYLRPYLEKCLPEIETEECFDYEEAADRVKLLLIKIDRKWDTTCMLDVLELTKSVAAIIDVPYEQLVLKTISHGCVQVVCHIPQASEVKCLTSSQKQKLCDKGVKQLVCDGTNLLTASDTGLSDFAEDFWSLLPDWSTSFLPQPQQLHLPQEVYNVNSNSRKRTSRSSYSSQAHKVRKNMKLGRIKVKSSRNKPPTKRNPAVYRQHGIRNNSVRHPCHKKEQSYVGHILCFTGLPQKKQYLQEQRRHYFKKECKEIKQIPKHCFRTKHTEMFRRQHNYKSIYKKTTSVY